MTAAKTRAQIGKRNRAAGAQAERDFARYLRPRGWPKAERKPDPGWSAGGRENRDQGDIKETPGLVFQLKYVKDGMTDREITRALQDAQDQAVAAAADVGILIERRAGKANAGNWWAHLTVWDLHALIAGQQPRPPEPAFTVPVRLLVADLLPILRAAGYGEPTTEAGEATA